MLPTMPLTDPRVPPHGSIAWGMPMGEAGAHGRVAEALRSASHITSLCHENPDADTVGAALAVRLIAEWLAIDAEVVSADPVPMSLAFLPRAHEIRRDPHLPPGVVVVCDAARLSRVGRIAVEHGNWLASAQIVNIDHHVTNDEFGAVNLVQPDAGATCEVLVGVVDDLAMPLHKDLATVLLAGIVRDTRGFADPGMKPASLRSAARLVEAGANLAEAHRRLLGNLPPSTMRLWGRVMADLRTEFEGRVVCATVMGRMLDETGTKLDDAEGIVEFLASGHGVQVAVLARELAPGRTRLSVRTSLGVDATRLVQPLGGGGHGSRSGCVVELDPLPALDALLVECGEYLSMQRGGSSARR